MIQKTEDGRPLTRQPAGAPSGPSPTVSGIAAHQAQGDWIEWSGGKCPVEGGSKVEVELGDGRKYKRRADHFEWHHEGDGTDIIAYRVVSS